MFKIFNNLNKHNLKTINLIKTTHQPLINTFLNQKCCHNNQTNNKPVINEFKQIYNLPQTRLLALMSRIKVHCTILTPVSGFSAMILSQFSVIESEISQIILRLGLSILIPLYCLSLLTDRLVGIIYYNKEKNLVKLAYINQWGKRQNIEIPTNDIIPFPDQPATKTDHIFLKIRRYSQKNHYKILTKHGKILDKENYEKIFIK